jgi:UDP:flavonoid glycosyltransferase YjiC (YdhE family)
MKILFFSPHTAIWVHAFPEALVAEALQQGGHEIVYVTCGRQLQRYCVAMSAHQVPPAAADRDKLGYAMAVMRANESFASSSA